jgi:hypothetical protein
MSAGKGDTPRAVNGDLYRRNFEMIFPNKTKRPYPDWICDECGRLHGKRPEGNPYGATWHIDTCGVCGTGGVEVTECRDFGHLREGWDK